MKKIMLVCSAGMSTSMLVSRMLKVADEKNIEVSIFAKAEAQAQAEKTEGKQLPNTSAEVDANLLALGLVGVLSGFGLLAQKKKED